MNSIRKVTFVLLWLYALSYCPFALSNSRIDLRSFDSNAFDGNKIGIHPERAYQVYLPSGYDTENRHYPVIYFLHSFFEDESKLFDELKANIFFDEAIKSNDIDKVIIVTANFNTPLGGNFYISSPVLGDWLRFVSEDLVTHIDNTYRTLRSPNSRAIWGNQIGAYGAIRVASRKPDVFGIVYAMHPVGTGHGNILMQSRPDWKVLAEAKSLEDLKENFFNQIFTAIYQANLANIDRPPLYFDPPAKLVGDKLILDSRLTEKLQQNFFLERHIGKYAEKLKSLRAFKFDWGRHDANQDHVYSNQFYSRKLNEFGIPHEAEEYNGRWGEGVFKKGGRIETDVIPFFSQHLDFRNL